MTKRNEPMQEEPADADLENCPICSGTMHETLAPFCSETCHTQYIEQTRQEDEAQAANYL
jgi:Fe-S-cluster-containing dehydrogenase component